MYIVTHKYIHFVTKKFMYISLKVCYNILRKQNNILTIMKRFKIELKSNYVYCTTYNHLYIYEKFTDNDIEYNKFVSSILISSPKDIDNIISELQDIKNKLINSGN